MSEALFSDIHMISERKSDYKLSLKAWCPDHPLSNWLERELVSKMCSVKQLEHLNSLRQSSEAFAVYQHLSTDEKVDAGCTKSALYICDGYLFCRCYGDLSTR